MRSLCPTCNERPVAINYIKEDVTHYRSQCDTCLRAGRKHKQVPLWYKKGYRKKPACELCGFQAKIADKQLMVFHLDGNLNNVDRMNLKTVCLNCSKEVTSSRKYHWKPSQVAPDF